MPSRGVGVSLPVRCHWVSVVALGPPAMRLVGGLGRRGPRPRGALTTARLRPGRPGWGGVGCRRGANRAVRETLNRAGQRASVSRGSATQPERCHQPHSDEPGRSDGKPGPPPGRPTGSV